MAEAAKISPYEQGYLSLLARRGGLRAKKIGRNWYTRVEWLNEYILKMKPAELIEVDNRAKNLKKQMSLLRKLVVASLSIAFVAMMIVVITVVQKDRTEKAVNANEFVPQEITKVPNDSGGFNVFGKGMIKMGEETR